jgi:hypothetical protein
VLSTQAEMTTWDNWALFGFTPSEFVPTAWELMPWSFLVDYFTNIGDILTSSVTDTSSVRWVNRSIIKTSTLKARIAVDGPASISAIGAGWSGFVTSDPCEIEFKRKTVSRSPGVGISLPTFQLSFDLGDGQLGNIAALLGQCRLLHPQSNPTTFHLRR